MSEEELNKLKAQIKKEIINELTKDDYVKDNMWRDQKREFTKMFYSKGYKDNYTLNIIFSGIQTVIRTSMGYSSVECIPANEKEEVRNRFFKMFNMYPKIDDEEK